MTKGEFTPVSTEESGGKPKKSTNIRKILVIVIVVLVVILVIAIIAGVVVHMLTSDDSSGGMIYEPNIDREIVFAQGVKSTFDKYTKKLRTLLDEYENQNQEGENFVDCSAWSDGTPPPPGRVCRFDLVRLGPECVWQREYGFDEGKPCIIISLDKKKDWVPKFSVNTTMPPDVRKRYHEDYIPVSCKGVNEADKENLGIDIDPLGPVQYWPLPGFPVQYFPYQGQEGYHSPLVAVQFRRPRAGVAIEIECQVWVDNLDASVDFELLID